MQWPEWAVRAWEPVAPYAEKAAIWRGYEAELQTLLIYAIGIAFYTAFVFTFYQNVSKRDAWHSKPKRGVKGWAVNLVESWLVFPAMSFLYFALLAGSLFLLAKSQDAKQIFLVSMSVVVGVRVVAHVSEAAAVDLAKLLPLGLLGVLIVDPSNILWSEVWARFRSVPTELPLLGRYFMLFLVTETLFKTTRRVVVNVMDRSALRRGTRPVKRKDLADTLGAETAATRTVPVKGGSKPLPREPSTGPGVIEKE